ncbi:MAG TPA: DUF3180 family protein, partial [Mycobacteriales bacterium]|nr:DUF3180 family protein [Mycobacteriales bacterium]
GAGLGTSTEVPLGAAVPLGLVAAVEAVLAKVVRDRVRHRAGSRRPLHPLQVARAAALAKASTAAGALLLGGYAGLLGWTALRADELTVAADNLLPTALATAGSAALLAAALLLERACRVPDPPDDALGSTS